MKLDLKHGRKGKSLLRRSFKVHYGSALQTYLMKSKSMGLVLAGSLYAQAREAEMSMREVELLHERILVEDVLPDLGVGKHVSWIRHAGVFFAVASRAGGVTLPLSRQIAVLSSRCVRLRYENTRHKLTEAALKAATASCALTLTKSDVLQKQLRHLSRQILLAQEEERKRISRELHDVVAQMLMGIHIRLASLKKELLADTSDFAGTISRTQKLVGQSVVRVQEFARELRPAVLDDIGLIPAIHAFVQLFSKRTHIRVHLRVFSGEDGLASTRRTVLYRVAQEAFTNVAKHAKADLVTVDIRKQAGTVCMQIKDNGRAFAVHRVLYAKNHKGLGLLGMRERIEMVGGSFKIESTRNVGTMVTAVIPI